MASCLGMWDVTALENRYTLHRCCTMFCISCSFYGLCDELTAQFSGKLLQTETICTHHTVILSRVTSFRKMIPACDVSLSRLTPHVELNSLIWNTYLIISLHELQIFETVSFILIYPVCSIFDYPRENIELMLTPLRRGTLVLWLLETLSSSSSSSSTSSSTSSSSLSYNGVCRHITCINH